MDLSQVIVLGIVRGTLYTLLAVGFALIFSVARVINLAHGAYYMMGAYFSYIIFAFVLGGGGGVTVVAAMIGAVALAGLVGLFQYRVLLRGLKNPLHDYILVMSLALALGAGEVFRQFFGVTGASPPALLNGYTVVFGVRVINQELLVLPVALVVIPALLLYLRYTRGGRSITAVAQNREGAVLMGIDPARAMGVVMFGAAALAGLAGTLISPVREVDPLMWVFPLIKSFAIVVAGGLGSIGGAIGASFILGVAETATGLRLGAQFTDLVSLVLIIVILAVRPTGLFGKEVKL